MERKPRWFCTYLFVFLWALAELLAFQSALANQSSCPTSISTGQPACGESSDVGSSAPSVSNTLHVGNPVDVASGNKYQSDIDAKLADSKLSFQRHYNSAQSNINIGMGNGWRHSYSVMLSRSADTQLQIVQSDGRRISFVLDASVFKAISADDGFIKEMPSGRHVWHLPDGREFLFIGSFLASITFENETLELLYRDTRLTSVTDSLGRSIDFEYAPGVIGLRSYSNSDIDVPAGHLASIVLPDSTRVEYEYDHQHNLVAVRYPRGTIRARAVHYFYGDERNKALLTERANALQVPFARWTYDDHERVSSYRSSWNIRADGSERGLPDLRFKYSQGSTANIGITSVEDREGWIREYEWLVGVSGEVREVTYIDQKKSITPSPPRDGKGSRLEESIIRSQHPQDHLTVIDRDEFGYPSVISYINSRADNTLMLRVIYSQNGKFVALNQIDETRNTVPSVNVPRMPESNSLEIKGKEIDELIVAGLLLEAARKYLEGMEVSIESGATITSAEVTNNTSNEAVFKDSSAKGNFTSNGTSSASSAFCSNALIDCSQLQRIMRYAELAQCAYENSTCQTGFVGINPSQLGLAASDLAEGSFRASIFYDIHNNEYIVAFAGTSALSAGDWNSNIRQEFGMNSFQYEKAIRLARELSVLNPGLSFTYTGHSLGGGLATAAVAAGHGEAVVFNPSGFTSEAASSMSVSHTRAEQHTNVFSVDGEILRLLQIVGALEDPPGTFHSMDSPRIGWILSNTRPLHIGTAQLSAAIELHSIDSVIQSISQYLSLSHCPP